MDTIQRITSFSINHDKLLPGLYVSRVDGDVTTYDMRTRRPNTDDLTDESSPFIPGKANVLRDGADAATFATGLMVGTALKAAELLAQEGISAAVLNFHTLKPIDAEAILNYNSKVRAIVTLIFYAPSISGSVYLVWQTLFSSDSYGWVNGTLINLGIIDDAILWFKNADYVMPLCIVVALWTSLGTAFLSFIAGLQNVPRHLYEAGAVDGIKNRWQELWYVTLPYMKPQLMFGAVLSITQSFGFGAIVDALCGFPSVEYAAHTIVHHLNDYGGQRYEMGYASAIAVILFIVMVGANLIIKKGLSKIGQ